MEDTILFLKDQRELHAKVYGFKRGVLGAVKGTLLCLAGLSTVSYFSMHILKPVNFDIRLIFLARPPRILGTMCIPLVK